MASAKGIIGDVRVTDDGKARYFDLKTTEKVEELVVPVTLELSCYKALSEKAKKLKAGQTVVAVWDEVATGRKTLRKCLGFEITK